MLFQVTNKKVFTVDPVTGVVRITPEDLNQISDFLLRVDPTLPEALPAWFHYEVDFTEFRPDPDGLTADIELVELPAGALVHAVKVKHDEAFTDGTTAAISAAVLSLGVAGDLDRYSGGATVNVFDAPGATNYDVKAPDGGILRGESHEAPWSLRAALTVTGANLSTLTTGHAEIWLLLSVAASPGA